MDTKSITGRGAMLIRVSKAVQVKDDEDSRQVDTIGKWLAKNGLKVQPEDVYNDVGSRSNSDDRVAFQRLIEAIQRGRYRWVIVDRQDRWGTWDADEWGHWRYVLRKAECHLYEAVGGACLTAPDVATRITTGLRADASQHEVSEKGNRSLSQLVLNTRRGLWPGGHIPFAMDVVCFSADDSPKWRLLHQGRDGKHPVRIKIETNGTRTEYRGEFNVPTRDRNDYLSLRPSLDKAKLDAVCQAFHWFASESVSYPEIGRRLNKMGIRPTYADHWDGSDIRKLLRSKIYIGIQTFSKSSRGDHFEVRDGEVVPRDRRDYVERDEAHHVESGVLFDPIVPMPLWDRVQRKIKATPSRRRAPKSSQLWLSGLIRCAGCGRAMRGVSHGSRNGHEPEYICSTYSETRSRGEKCPCMRNGVAHSVLEQHVRQYLADVGQDLGLVMDAQRTGDMSILKPLVDKQVSGISALFEAQARIVTEVNADVDSYPPAFGLDHQVLRQNPFGAVEQFEYMYRNLFARQEAGVREELERLDLEHTRLTQAYQGIVGERARAKVNAQIADLEAKMDDLEARLGNAADRAEELRADLVRIGDDLSAAESAIEGDDQRRCAAAVGRVVDHVFCRFEPTGRKCPTASLVEVVVVPRSGDTVTYPYDPSRPGRPCTWSVRWGSSSATATSSGPAWTTGRGWT